jgi:hypothetical protein
LFQHDNEELQKKVDEEKEKVLKKQAEFEKQIQEVCMVLNYGMIHDLS